MSITTYHDSENASPIKVATDTVQDKYGGEWSEGCFVGFITRSSGYLIIQGDKVYKCPMVGRRPQAEAYSSECLEVIRADNYDYINAEQ